MRFAVIDFNDPIGQADWQSQDVPRLHNGEKSMTVQVYRCLNCGFENENSEYFYGIIDDHHLICVDCWELQDE